MMVMDLMCNVTRCCSVVLVWINFDSLWLPNGRTRVCLRMRLCEISFDNLGKERKERKEGGIFFMVGLGFGWWR